MQRTLKRELKVLEIVKREGDITSGALQFIVMVACNRCSELLCLSI
jgi:hypothetical protein